MKRAALHASCVTALMALMTMPAAAQNRSDDGSREKSKIPNRVRAPQQRNRGRDDTASSQRQRRRNVYDRRTRTHAGTERVIIRHIYGESPRSIHYYYDLDTFYLPHGAASIYDPYSATWALEGAYLARHEQDRRNLLRLYNFRDMNEREGRLLSRHERAVRDGVQHLRAGQYKRALIDLTLAARLNQGDPACRIHLAQARLACGHYREAARVLRRALQLQPRLAYVDLDLASYYPTPEVLGTLTGELRDWLSENRAPADVHFLLGYLDFQQGAYDRAFAAFRRVAQVRPRDRLAGELLSVTQPVAASGDD